MSRPRMNEEEKLYSLREKEEKYEICLYCLRCEAPTPENLMERKRVSNTLRHVRWKIKKLEGGTYVR